MVLHSIINKKIHHTIFFNRKESVNGEEVNQFYTLLDNTLKLGIQHDSPPLTPPEQSSGDYPDPSRNKLSPVEEISESAASTLTTETDGVSKVCVAGSLLGPR